MAKKISLSLEIGGVKQNISSINDLEKAIKGAKEQLAGVEIGSKEFEKLSGEIRRAQNYAEDLQESLKPQELEKRVGAYAKVGSAIVSSFAAAQSAISLFGGESEEVAKAAAKAQAVLTIALTAREVAEGAVALKTVAANIATAASAAAANAANVATRALYTTIAANPYGAIIAALGLVVTAFVAFSSETEKAATNFEEITTATSNEAFELQQLYRNLTDYNVQGELRQQNIEKLKKDYPGFNAFLTKENELTKEGKELILLKIEAYKLQAKIQAGITLLEQKSKRLLELTTQDVNEQVGILEELEAFFTGRAFVSATSSYEVALRKNNTQIKLTETEIENVNVQIKEQTKLLEKNLDQQKAYNDKMVAQVEADKNKAKALELSIERQKNFNAGIQEGKKRIIDFSDQVKKLDEALKQYNQTIENLNKIQVDAKIIEDLKRIQEERKRAAETLKGTIDLVKESIDKLIVPPAPLPKDIYISTFKDLRDTFEKEFVNIGNGYKALASEFLKTNKDLNQQQKTAIADLTDGYEKLYQLIDVTPGFKAFINNLKDVEVFWNQSSKLYQGGEGFLQIIGEISAALGEFTIEQQKEGGLGELKFDVIKVRDNAQKYLSELRQSLFKPFAEEWLKQQIETQSKVLAAIPINEQTDKQRGELVSFITNLKKELSNLQTVGVSALSSITPTAEIRSNIDKTVDKFLTLSGAVIKVEQDVFKVNLEVIRLTEKLQGNVEELGRGLGGIALQNIQTIANKIFGIRNKAQKQEEDLRKKAKDDFVGLEDFRRKLIESNAAFQYSTEEQLFEAFVEFKRLEVEETKNAEQEKAQAIADNVRKVSEYIQVFSNTLGEISQLSSQSIQNQLQFLQQSYEAELEMIVGDTETANNKRIQLGKEYEAERKQIEKQGRLTSLRFSLAQAIANGAQAITAIFSNPAVYLPGGQLLAGIQTALIAGITAAEVAIINEQINMANMMRRGGLLKAQGGMLLSGPSHERGGIPIAQMGVIAEGQEAIINRNSLINYRDLLSTINQSGGGRPLVVNSFDDSRIVEAIAQQKQKPLRAYVLQSEITNEQALSKRLDDLSKI